jgi:hypothetical protein
VLAELVLNVSQRDMGAVGRQPTGSSLTDPGGATGDERHLSVEVSTHAVRLSLWAGR